MVFAPAFPAQGRFLLGERLVVVPPGNAPPATAAQGETLGTVLRQHADWPTACALLLPDIRSDADLDALTQLALEPGPRTLWCGSAGLAAALARRWCPVPPPSAPVRPGSIWVLGASHQPVARRQWARAMAAHPEALVVRHGDPQAWAQALPVLARGHVALALLDLSPLAPLAAADAAALLRAQVAQLAQCAQPPARLLVLGGDTARALAGATGVQQLVSGQPVRPGWGQAQWVGGRWDGVWMDCRSGAFGDDEDLLAAITACA